MNIFIFVGIATILLMLIFISYINVLMKQKTTKFIVVVTKDCEEICEGIIREIYFKFKNISGCDLIVIDKNSQDNTYKILNLLAKKHCFKIIKENDSQGFPLTKEYELIEINEGTSYAKIFKTIKEIRHSFTFNTNFL